MIEFIHSLLQRNPDARPSAAEIITQSLVMLHKISSQQQHQQQLQLSAVSPTSSSASSTFTPSSTLSSPSSAPPSPTSASSSSLSSQPSSSDPFSDLEDLGIIGRGQYSAVHKARRRSDGRLVAVKQVQIFEMDSDGRKECVNETRILASLSHPNIIQYLNYFTHDNDLYLILELAESGDLGSLIDAAVRQGHALLDERDIWHYFAQVASALQFMHARRILHRDIKPSNVFLGRERQVKLGDLGLGRFMSSNTIQAYSEVGTPFYMSPEAISGTGYGFASDVWSLGCLLYELTTLSSPFYQQSLNFYVLGNRIQECQYAPLPTAYTIALRQLVASILTPTPEHRPTAAQVCAIAQAACRAYDLGIRPDVQIQRLPELIERAQRGDLPSTRMEREEEEKMGEHSEALSPVTTDPPRAVKRKAGPLEGAAQHRSSAHLSSDISAHIAEQLANARRGQAVTSAHEVRCRWWRRHDARCCSCRCRGIREERAEEAARGGEGEQGLSSE